VQIIAGRYELVRSLGRGRTSEVHLARHRGPDGFTGQVAIKHLLPWCSDQSDFVDLLREEAGLVGRLDHPNIVGIRDFHLIDGQPWLVMDYVDGVDLSMLMQATVGAGRPMDLDVVLRVGSEVAAALHHAHAATGADGRPLGVVHRNVAPSNVLLSHRGAVKLGDFGLARFRRKLLRTVPGLFEEGYEYRSPQQLTGGELDARSDLFALGTLLYEAITGVNPFRGGTPYETMTRVVKSEIARPASLRPDVPPDLDAIVMRCLERSPKDRYDDALEVRQALGRVLVSRGTIAGEELVAAAIGAWLPGGRPVPGGPDASPPPAPVPAPSKPSRRPMQLNPAAVTEALAGTGTPNPLTQSHPQLVAAVATLATSLGVPEPPPPEAPSPPPTEPPKALPESLRGPVDAADPPPAAPTPTPPPAAPRPRPRDPSRPRGAVFSARAGGAVVSRDRAAPSGWDRAPRSPLQRWAPLLGLLAVLVVALALRVQGREEGPAEGITEPAPGDDSGSSPPATGGGRGVRGDDGGTGGESRE